MKAGFNDIAPGCAVFHHHVRENQRWANPLKHLKSVMG
jgi:hypothetical protein